MLAAWAGPGRSTPNVWVGEDATPAFDLDLADAKGYLAEAKSSAAAAAKESDQTAACDDANAAHDDAGAVLDQSNAFQDERNAVDEAIRSVTTAVSTLDTDLAAYQKLAAATSDHTAPQPPDAAAIRAVHRSATTTTAGWKSTAARRQSDIAKVLKDANSAASTAVGRYCG